MGCLDDLQFAKSKHNLKLSIFQGLMSFMESLFNVDFADLEPAVDGSIKFKN